MKIESFESTPLKYSKVFKEHNNRAMNEFFSRESIYIYRILYKKVSRYVICILALILAKLGAWGWVLQIVVPA